MTIAVHSRNRKNDYHKVFEAALRLPLDEQRRLRDELAKLSDVRLVAPANSKSAKREGKGKALADQVRAELASENASASLDETMQRLRGREWLS
jgi:hypothetical protein